MPQHIPSSATLRCLFRTAATCLLPFFLAGAGGDAEAATEAILELVSDYVPQTGAELDLVVQIINFGVAVTDNLRQSTRPGLSDNAILKYRAGAIALERAASRCRKALAIMQANRPRRRDAAPDTTARATTLTTANRPEAAPPTAPMSQSPAQNAPTRAQPDPVVAQAAPPLPPVPAQSAQKTEQPSLVPEEDYQFEADIEAMQRNALALIAALRAEEEAAALESPIARVAAVPEVGPRKQAA